MTIETKKEIKKAIEFGHSDESICEICGITPSELRVVKEEIQNGSV